MATCSELYILLVGVGQNSSGLLLQEEVRLVVGLVEGEVTGHGGESQVGTWAGLELGVGLRLTDLNYYYTKATHSPFMIVAVCGCKVPISCEVYTYIISCHDSSCRHTAIVLAIKICVASLLC